MLEIFAPFLAYWQDLRRGALLPSREDFNPARVMDFVGRIAIVERIDPSLFRSRLVGTEIVTRLGHEHTGEDFLNLMETPEGRQENLTLFNAVLDQPCGVWAERDMITDHGVYHAQILILPIQDKASNAGEFFAVFDFDRSLLALGGVEFERFGPLRRETVIDLGAGIPEEFSGLPSHALAPR
jgi:hypothetical protein